MPRRKDYFDLFDNFFGDDDFFTPSSSNLMKTDIKEKDNMYIIETDLPGFTKENISLTLNDGYLKISAKTKKEENDNNEKYLHQERYYGECSRNFYVGEELTEDDIDAEFNDGILKISIPKIEEKEKLSNIKQIEIK